MRKMKIAEHDILNNTDTSIKSGVVRFYESKSVWIEVRQARYGRGVEISVCGFAKRLSIDPVVANVVNVSSKST